MARSRSARLAARKSKSSSKTDASESKGDEETEVLDQQQHEDEGDTNVEGGGEDDLETQSGEDQDEESFHEADTSASAEPLEPAAQSSSISPHPEETNPSTRRSRRSTHENSESKTESKETPGAPAKLKSSTSTSKSPKPKSSSSKSANKSSSTITSKIKTLKSYFPPKEGGEKKAAPSPPSERKEDQNDESDHSDDDFMSVCSRAADEDGNVPPSKLSLTPPLDDPQPSEPKSPKGGKSRSTENASPPPTSQSSPGSGKKRRRQTCGNDPIATSDDEEEEKEEDEKVTQRPKRRIVSKDGHAIEGDTVKPENVNMNESSSPGESSKDYCDDRTAISGVFGGVKADDKNGEAITTEDKTKLPNSPENEKKSTLHNDRANATNIVDSESKPEPVAATEDDKAPSEENSTTGGQASELSKHEPLHLTFISRKEDGSDLLQEKAESCVQKVLNDDTTTKGTDEGETSGLSGQLQLPDNTTTKKEEGGASNVVDGSESLTHAPMNSDTKTTATEGDDIKSPAHAVPPTDTTSNSFDGEGFSQSQGNLGGPAQESDLADATKSANLDDACTPEKISNSPIIVKTNEGGTPSYDADAHFQKDGENNSSDEHGNSPLVEEKPVNPLPENNAVENDQNTIKMQTKAQNAGKEKSEEEAGQMKHSEDTQVGKKEQTKDATEKISHEVAGDNNFPAFAKPSPTRSTARPADSEINQLQKENVDSAEEVRKEDNTFESASLTLQSSQLDGEQDSMEIEQRNSITTPQPKTAGRISSETYTPDKGVGGLTPRVTVSENGGKNENGTKGVHGVKLRAKDDSERSGNTTSDEVNSVNSELAREDQRRALPERKSPHQAIATIGVLSTLNATATESANIVIAEVGTKRGTAEILQKPPSILFRETPFQKCPPFDGTVEDTPTLLPLSSQPVSGINISSSIFPSQSNHGPSLFDLKDTKEQKISSKVVRPERLKDEPFVAGRDRTAMWAVESPGGVGYQTPKASNDFDEPINNFSIQPDSTTSQILAKSTMDIENDGGNSTGAALLASLSSDLVGRQKNRPKISIGQLKMALFLESSKVHHGFGAHRIFANYLETVEKYITLGSHEGTRCVGLNKSSVCEGRDAMLKEFLKTRKLKRLHNKLVLAIMRESINTHVSARSIAQHLPERWKKSTKVLRPMISFKQEPIIRSRNAGVSFVITRQNIVERKSHLREWDSVFGADSGAWSKYGKELFISESKVSGNLINGACSLANKPPSISDQVLPSARLPGALEIDPFVRKIVEKSAMTVSDNAVWMLVVAVREHAKAIINEAISNSKELDNGYASAQPKSFMNSIVFQDDESNNTSKNKSIDDNGIVGTKRKMTELSVFHLTHAIQANPLLAGRNGPSARFAGMRNVSRLARSTSYNLDKVNCVVNAAIERAASTRQRLALANEAALAAEVAPSPKAHLRKKNEITTKKTAKTPAKSTKAPTKSNKAPTKATSRAQTRRPSGPSQSKQRKQALDNDVSISLSQPVSTDSVPSDKKGRGRPKAEKKDFKANPNSFVGELTPKLLNLKQNSNAPPAAPEKMSEQSQNAKQEEEKEKSSESNQKMLAQRRGSKNLAALMARSTSRPQSTTGDDKSSANTAENPSTSKPNSASPTKSAQKDEGSEKTEETKDPKSSASSPSQPSRPRGRGFGVKNLAAMRARSTVSESGDSGK